MRASARQLLLGTLLPVSLLLAGCGREGAGPLAPPAIPSILAGPGVPRPVLPRGRVVAPAVGRQIFTTDPYPNDEIIVELVLGGDVDSVNLDFGTTTLERLGNSEYYRLRLPPGSSVPDLLFPLMQHAEVEWAEPNFRHQAPESRQRSIAFNDGNATQQDYEDQNFLVRIRGPEAHAITRGAGQLVAAIDTGIDFSHPALAGRISSAGVDYVGGDNDPTDEPNGLDDDGDGQVDEAWGHGTHVAGLILLAAPDAQILPIRILDSDGNGSIFDLAKAILYATDAGATVINLSLGLYNSASPVGYALGYARDAGVPVAVSSGNDATDDPKQYPSADSHAIAVAATDSLDVKADFSNFGSHIDVSAPGVGLLSTFAGGGYAWWSGTSMAAPLAAGEAALVRSVRPSLSPDLLRQLMMTTAVDIDSLNPAFEGDLGGGRLDLYAAVTR